MTTLLQEFLKAPTRTASVISSSRAVVDAMLDPIDFELARVVVELGPGLGPITGPLLERLHPDGVLFAFEINLDFIQALRKRFRRDLQNGRLVLLERSAEEILPALDAHNQRIGRTQGNKVGGVDAVVSTLALSTMPVDLRERILGACRATLYSANGVMTQIMYGVAMHRIDMAGVLGRFFPEVSCRPVTWNVPPAFVYTGQGLNPLF